MTIERNENGIAKAGEVKTLADAGITEIRQINYLYCAAGNSVAAPAAVAAPAKLSEADTISRVSYTQSVPASNYRNDELQGQEGNDYLDGFTPRNSRRPKCDAMASYLQ